MRTFCFRLRNFGLALHSLDESGIRWKSLQICGTKLAGITRKKCSALIRDLERPGSWTFCQTRASQTKSGPTKSMAQIGRFYLWQSFRAFLRRKLKVIRDLLCEFALRVLGAVAEDAQNRQHHFVIFG